MSTNTVEVRAVDEEYILNICWVKISYKIYKKVKQTILQTAIWLRKYMLNLNAMNGDLQQNDMSSLCNQAGFHFYCNYAADIKVYKTSIEHYE